MTQLTSVVSILLPYLLQSQNFSFLPNFVYEMQRQLYLPFYGAYIIKRLFFFILVFFFFLSRFAFMIAALPTPPFKFPFIQQQMSTYSWELATPYIWKDNTMFDTFARAPHRRDGSIVMFGRCSKYKSVLLHVIWCFLYVAALSKPSILLRI